MWLLPGQGCEQPGKQIDVGDTLEGLLEYLERCHLYGHVLEDSDLWGSDQLGVQVARLGRAWLYLGRGHLGKSGVRLLMFEFSLASCVPPKALRP